MSDKPAWIRNHPPLDRKEINRIDASFRKRAQAVQAIDKMIGDIQMALKTHGVDRDTYIVFGSDNGFHMGEHRLMSGKQTTDDTDIRVPLVVTGPGVAAGHATNALAQNTDLCPTFDDIAGARTPDTVDGRSLTPFLADRIGGRTRDAVLIEHHGPNRLAGDPDLPMRASGNPPSYEAVRTAHEVYAEYADGEREYHQRDRQVHVSGGRTEPKPDLKQRRLAPHGKEWYVALALAEPWLSGQDDAPFPPTNRRIYERIRYWRGDAWNLERSQRVDDAIRAISRIAFGELEDPYTEARTGRIQNPRYAVGKRVADYRLVTPGDLDEVQRAAAARHRGPRT